MAMRHCVTEMQHIGNLAHVAVPPGAAAEPACSHHTSVWSGSGNFATLQASGTSCTGAARSHFSAFKCSRAVIRGQRGPP